jgi:hypothetical protein
LLFPNNKDPLFSERKKGRPLFRADGAMEIGTRISDQAAHRHIRSIRRDRSRAGVPGAKM